MIFNSNDKSDQQTDYSSNVTTIAAGSHVTGRIEVACELHIDGEVDAEINSSQTVKIGETGIVNGDLRAQTLIVSGKFFGNADCETIELVSGGEAEGKLAACSLSIDGSSSFQGESIRKQPGDAKVVSFSQDSADSDSESESDSSGLASTSD